MFSQEMPRFESIFPLDPDEVTNFSRQFTDDHSTAMTQELDYVVAQEDQVVFRYLFETRHAATELSHHFYPGIMWASFMMRSIYAAKGYPLRFTPDEQLAGVDADMKAVYSNIEHGLIIAKLDDKVSSKDTALGDALTKYRDWISEGDTKAAILTTLGATVLIHRAIVLLEATGLAQDFGQA